VSLENLLRKMVGQDPVLPCIDSRHGVRHPAHTWIDFAFYPPKTPVEPRKKYFYCKGCK
jgi:hypothetical protein